MSLSDKKHTLSLLLFRCGQLVLLAGYVCFMIGVTTSNWVIRPAIASIAGITDPKEYKKLNIVKHYGIFSACKQGFGSKDSRGECGSMTGAINYVDDDAIRLVQALMVISCILFMIGFILELIQFMPITIFRNFLAENRVVEMFSGIASVCALVSMVIYAGEVKNKAELFPGQEDEKIGWSFTISITGLSLSIVGLLTITMFRHLPVSTGGTHYLKGGSWLRPKINDGIQ